MENIKEQLASVQHDIWAHWMKYQFSQCKEDEDGNLVIPKEKVDRWTRQINTNYSDLTEKEKQSDRDQVDKFIHLMNRYPNLIKDEDFAQNIGTGNKRLEVWDHHNIFNGRMLMWVNFRENDLPKMCIIDSRSQKMAEVQSFILTHYEVKRLIECFTIVLDKMPEEKNFK